MRLPSITNTNTLHSQTLSIQICKCTSLLPRHEFPYSDNHIFDIQLVITTFYVLINHLSIVKPSCQLIFIPLITANFSLFVLGNFLPSIFNTLFISTLLLHFVSWQWRHDWWRSLVIENRKICGSREKTKVGPTRCDSKESKGGFCKLVEIQHTRVSASRIISTNLKICWYFP